MNWRLGTCEYLDPEDPRVLELLNSWLESEQFVVDQILDSSVTEHIVKDTVILKSGKKSRKTHTNFLSLCVPSGLHGNQ